MAARTRAFSESSGISRTQPGANQRVRSGLALQLCPVSRFRSGRDEDQWGEPCVARDERWLHTLACQRKLAAHLERLPHEGCRLVVGR
eukprot:458654-Prymnesium_polylepis.1